MPPTAPIILHLTDLHFGWEAKDINAQNRRDTSQRTLLNTLAGLPQEWKPTIVCLTGDIGWYGLASDYEAAKRWLDELLACCNLDYSRVLVAAGNHDIIRDAAKYMVRPNSYEEADEVLGVPIGLPYKASFAHFTEFCRQANIPPMHIHGQESWLVGERPLDGIRFIAVNSSWFCRAGNDRNKLWVGLPQLQDLESQQQLGRIEDPATPLTVALVHHPPSWWHENEQHRYAGGRPATRDFLAFRSHLVLTGHTHAESARPDRMAQAAYHFPGSAAYAGGSYDNGFRLIRLAERAFDYQSYKYDPGADRSTWRLDDEGSVERQTTSRTTEVGETLKKKSMP